jgi:ethanolamine ammonia-lyase large subunit
VIVLRAEKVKRVFAMANEFKEGDTCIGGTSDDAARNDARKEIAAMKIGAIANLDFVEDSVTDVVRRTLDRQLLSEISGMTVAGMKDALFGPDCGGWVRKYSDGLPSEAIAAAVKIMGNEELSRVSRAVFNPLHVRGRKDPVPVGSAGHFGSRIQPNSPGDDEEEILISVLEGLSYGCGDVIIGLNPASDDVETIARTEKLLQAIVERLGLPTRYCVLSDMVKQSAAAARAKIDVGFQSLAGTSRSLVGMLGLDVDGLLDLSKSFSGLYFETGQGSEVTNGASCGIDMVTLESRCYGLARYLQKMNGGKWMIVNDVAGFIGPEVFRTGRQLLRACLEDMVMAKLHGITMGLDVCSTFHMGIDPLELMALTEKIVQTAAPAYLMGVAGKADPMLGILTTSYREHPRLRMKAGKRISTAMAQRLASLGVAGSDGIFRGTPESVSLLYAGFMKEGGDRRGTIALKSECVMKIGKLKEKGCDLGYGMNPDMSDPPAVLARLDKIYRHARASLYAGLDDSVIRDCCPGSHHVSSCSADREDYLLHPPTGELIRKKNIPGLKRLYADRGTAPRILFAVSDGLNANAVNENLRGVLPKLRWELKEAGFDAGDIDVVIRNGRVRAGYHAAKLVAPEILVHLIGERPGTGYNQLSAYLTYGRDKAGRLRWNPDMDHSLTTAICSIHHSGKTPDSAVADILGCVRRMSELKCSGVALGNGRA